MISAFTFGGGGDDHDGCMVDSLAHFVWKIFSDGGSGRYARNAEEYKHQRWREHPARAVSVGAPSSTASRYNHSVVYNTIINPTPVTVSVQKKQ